MLRIVSPQARLGMHSTGQLEVGNPWATLPVFPRIPEQLADGPKAGRARQKTDQACHWRLMFACISAMYNLCFSYIHLLPKCAQVPIPKLLIILRPVSFRPPGFSCPTSTETYLYLHLKTLLSPTHLHRYPDYVITSFRERLLVTVSVVI